jgi:Mrp family chromosome partitioning ATPase
MVTKEQIEQALGEVLVPEVSRSVAQLNMIQGVGLAGDTVELSLASTALSQNAQEWVKTKAEEVVGKLSGVKGVDVSFVVVKPVDLNRINRVIAVMSGKGGVGKSLVASLTAVALRRQGYEVGILDADITGSSIPRMFGVTARPTGSDTGIMPVTSKSGTQVMSVNLLLPSEDDAVIWRGPLISKVITQFWEEVLWGRLDYLVVDLPPGTADASLTVLQNLPVSGIIIVFTPQDLTAMIVRKAVNMARKMEKPILGVVENMSYLYVPEIDKRVALFGESRGEEMARAAQAPLLGQLPIDPDLARLCDEGEVERYDSDAFKAMTQALDKAIPSE